MLGKDHLEHLAQELRRFVRHVIVLRGGMSGKARRTVADKLAAIPDDEERLLLATGRYIGEGFDDARLDTLFLAMPVSWKGTLTVQRPASSAPCAEDRGPDLRLRRSERADARAHVREASEDVSRDR